MDIQDWKIISTLHKYKNITKTAGHLYISQPALTARIKKIEQHFDIVLVLRHRRGVEFTADGEYLVKWAHTFIKQNEQIYDHLHNMRDEVTGTLKIGVTKYLAKYKMPKILLQFKKMYPLVEFQVKTGWSIDIYRLVLNQDVHVGFIRGDYPWRGVKELLFEESLCVAYTKPF